MTIQVKKWGNSASVRIPASLLAAAGLKIDDPVRLHEEAGRIIIEPVADPAAELQQLLDAIEPEMLHGEIDGGDSVGNEAW